MQLKTYNSFSPQHSKLYNDILALTQPIRQFYPNYEDWFKNTFISGLKRKKRLYILAQTETGILAGCILIKNTADEKKICTLFVKPEFRKQGIATALIRETIQLLGEYPLITVSQENMKQVFPLLTRLGFRLSTTRQDLYRPGSTEYFFNGKGTNTCQERLISVLNQRAKQLERC